MAAIHCIGDSNNAGGIVTNTPNDWVTVDGDLVAVNGSIGSGHPPCPTVSIHCAGNWQTSGGDPWITIDDIPVNFDGDPDTCGHSRSSSSHGWVESNT